jgi:hypothetical protein
MSLGQSLYGALPASSLANHFGGDGMQTSLRNTDRRVHGDSRNTSARHAKRENQDFIKEQALKKSAKQGSELTGLSERAFENIRLGRNKINFDNLIEWMQRDPDFAAAFNAHVGFIRPDEAEFAGAYTRAVNAYQRMRRE